VWELVLLAVLFAASLKDGIFIGIGKRGPVFLPLDRHVIITGPTRSGKTSLAKKIIKRAGLPALVLDWHGEYGGLRVDARLLKISLENFDKKLLAEILGLALNLNEPSVYFLYRAIRQRRLAALRERKSFRRPPAEAATSRSSEAMSGRQTRNAIKTMNRCLQVLLHRSNCTCKEKPVRLYLRGVGCPD
jgi:hypothetical protein